MFLPKNPLIGMALLSGLSLIASSVAMADEPTKTEARPAAVAPDAAPVLPPIPSIEARPAIQSNDVGAKAPGVDAKSAIGTNEPTTAKTVGHHHLPYVYSYHPGYYDAWSVGTVPYGVYGAYYTSPVYYSAYYSPVGTYGFSPAYPMYPAAYTLPVYAPSDYTYPVYGYGGYGWGGYSGYYGYYGGYGYYGW